MPHTLTDEEIRNMTKTEAEAYIELHPEEAWHFAKIYAESAAKQTRKAIKHLVGKTKATFPKTAEVYVDANGKLQAPDHILQEIEKAKIEGRVIGDSKMDGHFSGQVIASDLQDQESLDQLLEQAFLQIKASNRLEGTAANHLISYEITLDDISSRLRRLTNQIARTENDVL